MAQTGSVSETGAKTSAKKARTAGKTTAHKKKLVIVESPSKAKTIGKYLGSTYKVVASVGHVRDLPSSKLGIDIEGGFEPQYISIRGKGQLIKELKTEAKKASKVYLATDPDREGEAISWHLAYLLGIDPSSKCRVAFNEITKDTIKEAIKNPREIDLDLVDAQQARRVLDRLVGYQISPLLWRKIRRGLSAGRVQSAALKILCDREKEIQDFDPQEYWTIDCEFKKGRKFTARLEKRDGEDYRPSSEAEKDQVLAELEGKTPSEAISKNEPGVYRVTGVTEKDVHPRPYAPFTTSSMQQEASTRLNFGTSKTMKIAQQLYEGVDLHERGTLGLITYLRTDSVRISDTAKAAAANYIEHTFGKEYVGHNYFSNKKKEIQDAHEAIRPTNVDIVPDDVKSMLTLDQYKLYKLVWNRFIASQMTPATVKSVTADIVNGRYTFTAKGSKVLFDGYQKVYKYKKDDEEDKLIPGLEKGEVLEPLSVDCEQNFTKPPSRYTEASLVKELEEKNIGRPSTYAPIISTLSERKYVKKEKKSLVPTELGFTVNDIMNEYFTDIVDVKFTAAMEDKLDDVEAKGTDWKKLIEDFYGSFSDELEKADSAIEKVEIKDRPTGEVCELCGRPMVIKTGRFGDFMACSGYPECKNTRPIVKPTGVMCPECGKEIVERRSRRGKIFYGCSGYPDCKVSFWYRPVNKTCPKCGSLLIEKKGRGTTLACSSDTCDYKE